MLILAGIRIRYLKIAKWTACLSLWFWQLCFAETVSVTGQITLTVFEGELEVPKAEAIFSAELESKKYILTVTNIKLPGKGPLKREFAFHDGSTFQTYVWNPVDLPDPSKGGFYDNATIAKVFTGTVPRELFPSLLGPWLTYCSHIHPFKGITNSLAFPNIFPDIQVDGLTVDNLDRTGVRFGIGSVSFLKPGLRFKPDVSGNVYLPVPFDRGYVGATFRVLAKTNVSGYALAQRSEMFYTNFVPDHAGIPAALRPTDHVVVELISAHIGSRSGVFEPKLDPESTVSDERGGPIAAAVYEAKSVGWLKNSDNATRVDLFEHEFPGDIRNKKRSYTILFLAAIAGGTIAVIYRIKLNYGGKK
jgi:hypothetical protein